MKKIFLIALLLLSSQLQAEELPAWLYPVLKVNNPNELAVWTSAGETCPVTNDDLNEITSGVLIRSRVKPLLGDEWVKNSVHLQVTVDCARVFVEGNTYAYKTAITWSNASGQTSFHYAWDYGRLGGMDITDPARLKTSIKGSVEAAITDYIKANFDL